MSHFDTGQWVDYARGLGNGADRAAMEMHLSLGCSPCRRLVEVLGRVAAFARADLDHQPSDAVVRMARAIYTHRKPERLLARLIFDSFREPLPAGVRTQDRLTRHALYEAGNFYVDLRVEHRAADMATLVGQFADRDHPGADATDVRVLLMQRTQIIASAPCDRFGEFHMDYRPTSALRLDVCLGADGRRLGLALGGLLAGPVKRRGARKRPPAAR